MIVELGTISDSQAAVRHIPPAWPVDRQVSNILDLVLESIEQALDDSLEFDEGELARVQMHAARLLDANIADFRRRIRPDVERNRLADAHAAGYTALRELVLEALGRKEASAHAGPA